MILIVLFAYTLPFDSPLTDQIEYLQLRGLVDIPSLRPYDAQWVTGQIDRILVSDLDLNLVDRKVISHFIPLMTKRENFAYLLHFMGEYHNEPLLYYGALDERLGGKLTNNLRFSHAMKIRRANELDPLGPRNWNDFQVYLTEGLIGFSNDRIRFDLGRRNYLWGPGDTHGLLLSLDPEGYDGFLFQIPLSYLEFYGLFSVLESARPKFLSVHRLGLNLRGFLKLGFTEAIFSVDSLEPLYLNIFLPFYLAQWGRDRYDNIMWSFDMQLHAFNSILYAELLIDDYMYEDDPYPDKLAYQVGLKSLLWNFIAKFNYTRVDKWVYTHHEAQNVYERYGRCLGYPLGNDVDELSLKIKYVNRFDIFPYISTVLTRKGEGSIYIPYEEEGGTINPPFPSGVVDRQLELKIGVDYNLLHNFYITAEIGKVYHRNVDHISGQDENISVFAVRVGMIL
jgi:hypothetical protein